MINEMKVILNDNPHEVAEGTTLGKFIESLEIQIQGIAIAINTEVIPKSEWSKTILTDEMALMLIQAVSGG